MKSIQWEMSHSIEMDCQAGRQTVAFHNFVKAPNKINVQYVITDIFFHSSCMQTK